MGSAFLTGQSGGGFSFKSGVGVIYKKTNVGGTQQIGAGSCAYTVYPSYFKMIEGKGVIKLRLKAVSNWSGGYINILVNGVIVKRIDIPAGSQYISYTNDIALSKGDNLRVLYCGGSGGLLIDEVEINADKVPYEIG